MATSTRAPTRMFIAGAWEDALSGDVADATSPATGEPLGPVAQGDREDARRAIAAAKAAFPAWERETAFARAAALRRVADVCERRRDDLARALTLDQGKPLHAEAYDEVDELVAMWRGAAEDGIRLEGAIPPSMNPGPSRPARPPPARPDRGRDAVELAVHDAGRDRRPGARVREHGRVDAGAEHGRLLGPARRVRRRGRPPARRLQLRHRPGARGRRRDGRPRGHRRRRLHRLDRDRPAHRAQRAAGKAQLLEMGGNGPLVVMDDADVDAAAEAAVMACFLCAGQSCTAGELLLVHEAVRDAFVARARRARHARHRPRRPVRPGHDARPAEQRAGRGEDGRARRRTPRGAARRVVAGGARAGGFPTVALLARDDPRRRSRRRAGRDRGDVRPDRAGRVDRRRSRRRSTSPTGRGTGCCRRSSRRTSRRGCASPTRSAPAS